MARLNRLSGVSALALALAACDGGNSGPPAPANAAPVFTSAATGSVVENASGTAYLATATDANGDALTFTIGGGTDAARFAISASGAVQFLTPPNFDAPGDANGDNSYLIEVLVSDGRLSATQPVEIKVTNSAEGVSVRRVATGITDLAGLTPIPGETGFLLAQTNGNVSTFDPATGARTLVYSLSPVIVDPFRDFPLRLVHIAAAPDYKTSGGIYVVAHQSDRLVTAATRVRYYYKKSTGSLGSVELTGTQSFVGDYGWVGVGPDGYVYVLSYIGLPGTSSPDVDLGAVQRFAKNFSGDCAALNCFVPAPGNPYLAGGGDPTVFHYGLGSPNGGSFYNGTLLFADPVEINMASLTVGGSSFGWPFVVGQTRQMPGGADSPVDPVILFESGSATGRVIGGFVYTGPIASLSGKYIFGTADGQIRTVPATSLVPGVVMPASATERREQDFMPDAGTITDLKAIVRDQAGNIWLTTRNGEIFEVRGG